MRGHAYWQLPVFLVGILLFVVYIVRSTLPMFADPVEQAQRELLPFYRSLELGQTREEALARFEALGDTQLILLYLDDDAFISSTEWLVRTSSLVGATNWLLWIEFDDEGAIKALRIRVADSRKRHPEAAPKDKVKSALGETETA